MKPLATLGEVMNDIDWRAQRRLAGVPSRPPPADRAGRPDRGYVEQPEERVEPVVLKKRGLIPMADLERIQLEELAEELGEPSPFEDTPPPRLTLQPQPETQPSEAPISEATEMPAKKARKQKVNLTPEMRERIVRRHLEVVAASPPGTRGYNAKVARELGITEAIVSYWVLRYQRGLFALPGPAPISGVNGSSHTLISSPQSGPVSIAPTSAAGELPPLPTVSLTGLEEYVKAVVKQAVAAEFRRRLQGMAD